MKTDVIVQGDILPDGTMYEGPRKVLGDGAMIEVDPNPERCRDCGEHMGRLLSGHRCGNCRNAALREANG